MNDEINYVKQLWDKFKEDIKHNNRYFVGDNVVELLDKCKTAFEPRKTNDIFMSGTTGEKMLFHRARIGDYCNKEDTEMLAPPTESVQSGRGNPFGISYLYVASDVNTAIAEVKPNKGDEVTVAKIIVPNKCIFSFVQDDYKDTIHDNKVKSLLKIINEDFSSVITVKKEIEYLPFQFISEYIKKRGYDGLSFSSSVGKGCNHIIFNHDNCYIEKKELYYVSDIKYKIEKNNCNI